MNSGTSHADKGRSVRLLESLRPLLAHPRAPWAIAALATMFCLPALFVGFATDDHFLLMVFKGFPGLPEMHRGPFETFRFYYERDPATRQIMMDRGLLPWWTGETMRMAFMRPLTSATHYLDFTLFGETAWPMHVQSLLWSAGAALLAGAIYRRILAPAAWLGALAMTLYALDDARGISAGWLSGRNAVLTTFFGLAAILCHDLWRRGGKRYALPLGLISLALGLLSGEASLACGGYLFAYAVFIDPAGFRRGFMALLPYVPLVAAWAFVYHHYGFGTHGSDGYADPMGEPRRYLGFLAHHLPVLLFTQFGLPESTFYNFLAPWQARIYWAVAVCAVCGFGWLLWPVVKARREARFFALGMLLAVLPTCAVTPQDRLLGLVGLGGAGLIAMFIERVVELANASAGRWQRIARRVVPHAINIHLIAAPLILMFTSSALFFIERGGIKLEQSLPRDAKLKDDTLIMVNAMADLMGAGAAIMRSSLDAPVPKNTWMLTATDAAVHVERVDERTIIVSQDGTFLSKPFSNLFRSPENEPMKPGDTVKLSRMTAEVLDADETGRAQHVKFTFDSPLEDPSFRWMQWNLDHFEPYTPPPVGQRGEIPGTSLAKLIKSITSSRGNAKCDALAKE